MKPIHISIFDLDKTVIDSDHRTPYKENGDLCLSSYRAKQTHDNIMQDQLLPLASVMQTLIKSGAPVVIVTARRMTKSDYIYLRQNGLKTALICSRDQLFKRFHTEEAQRIYALGDAEYKRHWFEWLQARFGVMAQFSVYDDHGGVLAVAREMGFICHDAIRTNELLRVVYDMGYSEGIEDALDYRDVFKAMGLLNQIEAFESDREVAA